MPIRITAQKDGPYQVESSGEEIELTDAQGTRYDIGGKKKVYLCRCGASVRKPFCDGTHSKIGFQAAEAAVARQGG